ncbi:MAG TPA: efflux RND transporter periplasmic adaptor subunit [bacterium]|nr:efflux RND transporter periplasmic adaptor subunit [bacterium]
MRNRFPLIAVVVVVLALVIALVVSQSSGRRSDSESSGTIESYEVQVASKVSARVVAVRCEEGQTVKSGDTLLILDDADYRNAALAARAQLLATQANLSAVQSRASLADSSLARLRRLFAAGNLSRQEMDKTESDARAADDALAAARTAVDAARAQADIAAERLSDCTVTAPIAGTASVVAFRVGETVIAGSTPVTIIDLNQTWLTVYLAERLLGRVKLGDSCRVRVDAYPKRDFKGVLSFIADKAEFTPKDIQTKEERINQVYRVKITLPNPDRILKPGMPADAYLSLH